MEKIGSDVLAAIFRKNRPILNQWFNYAKHLDRTLEGEVFFSYLTRILEPLVKHHEDKPPEKLETFTLQIYKQIVELYSGHYFASEDHYPCFEEVFIELVEHFRNQVFEHPETFSRLGNAVLNLSKLPGIDLNKWSSILKRTAFSNVDDFLKTGYVAAWLSGCASYRKNSLIYLTELDKETFIALFDLKDFDLCDSDIEKMIDKLVLNGWTSPSKILRKANIPPVVFNTIGGFRGFDQPFHSSPYVYEMDDQVFATDQINTYLLFADAFGQQLVQIDHIESKPVDLGKQPCPISLDGGNVYFKNQKLDYLPRINHTMKSEVFCGQTFLLSSHYSYKVFIFGITDN